MSPPIICIQGQRPGPVPSTDIRSKVQYNTNIIKQIIDISVSNSFWNRSPVNDGTNTSTDFSQLAPWASGKDKYCARANWSIGFANPRELR
jgi:hypothetical protein